MQYSFLGAVLFVVDVFPVPELPALLVLPLVPLVLFVLFVPDELSPPLWLVPEEPDDASVTIESAEVVTVLMATVLACCIGPGP